MAQNYTYARTNHGARPALCIARKNTNIMGVFEIKSMVKCDDTVSGVGEALNAGCWGVGHGRYSNYSNINSLEKRAALSESKIARRMPHKRKNLEQSSAHYVIDSLFELPEVVGDINARLARGEKP